MKTLLLMLLLCSPVNDNYIESAARLMGAGDVDELTDVQLEQIEDLHEHPIAINFTTRSGLSGCGLLSQFQIASVMDYIERNGQILSPAELASVPGIGQERARDLSHFLTFTYIPLSEKQHYKASKWPEAEISMYNSIKESFTEGRRVQTQNKQDKITKKRELTCGSGVKALVDYKWDGREIKAGLGAKDRINSCYISFKGRKHIDKVIIGSYNVRWGQGLMAWSGFSMSGLSSVAGLARNASGVGASNTLSEGSALQGAAFAASCGPATLQTFRAADVGSGLRLEYWGSHCTFALSTMLYRNNEKGNLSQKEKEDKERKGEGEKENDSKIRINSWILGADAKATLGAFTLFGETGIHLKPGKRIFDGKPGFGAIGGIIWNIDYRKRAAIQIRYYNVNYDNPLSSAAKLWSKCSDEAGLALGFEWKDFNWIAEAATKTRSREQRLRSTINYSLQIKSAELRFRHKLKWNSEDKGPKNELSIELRLDKKVNATSKKRGCGNGSDGKNNDKAVIEDECSSAKTELYGAVKAMAGFSPGKETGYICYADVGMLRKLTDWAVYFRALYFHTDSWNSRLYSYGRDVPGSFSVPAYYGKGIELSLNARCKHIATKLCYTYNVVPPTKSRPTTELRNRIEVKLYLSFR